MNKNSPNLPSSFQYYLGLPLTHSVNPEYLKVFYLYAPCSPAVDLVCCFTSLLSPSVAAASVNQHQTAFLSSNWPPLVTRLRHCAAQISSQKTITKTVCRHQLLKRKSLIRTATMKWTICFIFIHETGKSGQKCSMWVTGQI